MSLQDRLDRVTARHTELAETLANPDGFDNQAFARLSKEYSDLTPVVQTITELRRIAERAGEVGHYMDQRVGECNSRFHGKSDRWKAVGN